MIKNPNERKQRVSLTLDQESLRKAHESHLNLSEVLQAAVDDEYGKGYRPYGNVDEKGIKLMDILGKPLGYAKCTGKFYYDDSNCQLTGCGGIYYPYWSQNEADRHLDHWHAYDYYLKKRNEKDETA